MEWISVDERLPDREWGDESADVLIVVIGHIMVGTYNHLNKRWHDNAGYRIERGVTHWCPLPDLPEVIRYAER